MSFVVKIRRATGVLLIALVGVFGVAVPASATVDVTVNTGSNSVNANVRSGPNTSAAVTRVLANGSHVALNCYARGSTVSGGPYNVTSNLWYQLSPNGDYIWDGLLNTGSNNPVTAACGSSGASTAAAAANAFVSRYNGAYIDVDGYYGAQCWDLADLFALNNGAGTLYTGDGAASGIYENYNTNGNATNFLRIANSTTDPNSVPRPGDIIVWNRNLGGGFGHVAVVVSASWTSVTVFEQNPGAAHLRTTNYANVEGWLRLRKWA